jgi:hypothetical protein
VWLSFFHRWGALVEASAERETWTQEAVFVTSLGCGAFFLSWDLDFCFGECVCEAI